MTQHRMTPLGWLAAALIVAIGLMAIIGTLAMTTYGGYYGMMGGGSWAWGLVMMVVPGIVLVLILVAALGGLDRQPSVQTRLASQLTALDILNERYARGELSRDEYLRVRDDLVSRETNS